MMPIKKRWTKFKRENVEKLPNKEGSYELANAQKRIIDIGGSNVRVKARLISHLVNNKYPTAKYFRCDFASLVWDLQNGIDKEASHARKFFLKHGRKPRYTKRSPHIRNLL